jgi:hypothetical protein
MSDFDPYAAPRSPVADVPSPPGAETARLNRVASGQRLLIYALLVSVVAIVLQASIGPLAAVITLAASLAAIVGVLRTAAALGRSVLARVLYVVAMLLPLINLLAMLAMSAQATKALRAAGYRVGLLGAKAR